MTEDKENPSQAIIEITQSGPIRITGKFQIYDLKRGKEDTSGEVLLCGCGKSANKPYCDDSHKSQ
jgi:CDGSH-type Zn-finger protein